MNNDVHNSNLEQLLNDADELLRCAKATAYESADGQKGDQRHHALAVVHLIEMAREKVDAALLGQVNHADVRMDQSPAL